MTKECKYTYEQKSIIVDAMRQSKSAHKQALAELLFYSGYHERYYLEKLYAKDFEEYYELGLQILARQRNTPEVKVYKPWWQL